MLYYHRLYGGSDIWIQGIRSDRVPEELWIEVHNIAQEAVTKTIPSKRNSKRLSEEALQIAEKRREAKGKGEKERYPSEFRVPKNSKER